MGEDMKACSRMCLRIIHNAVWLKCRERGWQCGLERRPEMLEGLDYTRWRCCIHQEALTKKKQKSMAEMGLIHKNMDCCFPISESPGITSSPSVIYQINGVLQFGS